MTLLRLRCNYFFVITLWVTRCEPPLRRRGNLISFGKILRFLRSFLSLAMTWRQSVLGRHPDVAPVCALRGVLGHQDRHIPFRNIKPVILILLSTIKKLIRHVILCMANFV